MTYRIPMPERPWLTGAAYDKYSGKNTLHYDLYAWQDAFGFIYFELRVTVSGKEAVAWSMWRYEQGPILRALPYEDKPRDLHAVTWSKANRGVMNWSHPRLLRLCKVPPGYATKSVLCHYVKAYDGDPWPRGSVNVWRPMTYGEGKKPGRRPKQAPPILDLL